MQPYCVILLRDFSGPNYDWPNGTPRPNYYRVVLLIYLEISVDPTMIPLMARQGQIAIV
jgi:hypothetical protein